MLATSRLNINITINSAHNLTYLYLAKDKCIPVAERDFQTRRILTGHYNSVQAIDWSGDNQRVVSASQSGNVVIWDGMLGRKLNRIRFDMK